MGLAELKQLAQRARHPNGLESHDYSLPANECPSCVANDVKMELEPWPELVLAMARCIEAADALRGVGYEPRPSVARVAGYDNMRSELDRLITSPATAQAPAAEPER